MGSGGIKELMAVIERLSRGDERGSTNQNNGQWAMGNQVMI